MDSREEFCENIRRYEKAMYNLAFSLTKNEADAGDVVGEAIYRAYTHLDTLKSSQAFKAWILKIVHNTAAELIRKNSRMVLVDEVDCTEAKSYESGIATRLSVRQAVEELKQPYQSIVLLFYYENLSITEISEILGSSTAAVKKQLQRARAMLMEKLKEDFSR